MIDSLFSINKSSSPITSPKTPRHKDVQEMVFVTPKNQTRQIQNIKTPESLSRSIRITPYSQARQLFTSSTSLIGRETERNRINEFVTKHIESSTSGCLYVSGPPGTGKSAFITNIVQQFADKSKTSIINCMSLKNTNDLLQILSKDFDIVGQKMDVIKEFFLAKSNKEMNILVLDELDRLVDVDLELLYSLFEWSIKNTSNLILIGIANALDLTDRVLPRLKTRNIKPTLLPFMPYTAEEINNIITKKLTSLSLNCTEAPLFQPSAILLCSKKVASQTGDLRKAFDIIKRALYLIEAEVYDNRQPLSESINCSSPVSKRTLDLTIDNAPKVSIAQMAKVTAQIFSNGTSSRLNQLNIQQKAILCTLAMTEKKSRTITSDFPSPSKTGKSRSTKLEYISTKQLYDNYTEVCKRDNILHPLSNIEFRDILSGLETLSLIEFIDCGNKNGSLGLVTPTKSSKRKLKPGQLSLGSINGSDERRISSVVGFKELESTIHGPGSEILKEILIE